MKNVPETLQHRQRTRDIENQVDVHLKMVLKNNDRKVKNRETTPKHFFLLKIPYTAWSWYIFSTTKMWKKEQRYICLSAITDRQLLNIDRKPTCKHITSCVIL